MQSDKTVYCTIITANYIHYAMTLFDSLVEFKEDISFVIGVSDIENFKHKIDDKRISILGLDTLIESSDVARKIYKNYYPKRMDHLRWSMKPVILKYLLSNGYQKTFWLDCDLFFCNNFEFLERELEDFRFLLSPHWKSIHPWKQYKEFYTLMQGGLYNAGFVGARSDSIDILEWWANACAFRCERDYSKGFLVDQLYLEVVPIYFENVGILEHRGCNLASWNIHLNKRSIVKGGKVKINNKWDIIFMHMTNGTISCIEKGDDKLLKPYLQKWQNMINKNRECFGIKPPVPNTRWRKLQAFFKRNIRKLFSIRFYIQH